MQALSILTSLALAGCHWVFGLEPGPDAGPDDGDARAKDAPPPGVCPASGRLCLDFEQTSGDSSMYMHHPSSAGLVYIDRDDQFAAELTTTAEIRVGQTTDLNDLGDATLELWIQPKATQLLMNIQLVSDPMNLGLQFTPIGLGSDEVRCAQGGVLGPGHTVDREQWTHIACVYTTTQLQLYVDGSRVRCELFDQTPKARPEITIGFMPSTGQRFAGAIDNVHLHDTALTEQEICTIGGDGNCTTVVCP
ncbi:MAG TPA: LamG domain-containing protein [Kofleriaceae bacterium]